MERSQTSPAVKRYADRLGKVKVGSANVTFRRLGDVGLPVLVEMATQARDLVFGPNDPVGR
ncbi:MAG: hypothetical protein FIA92_06950 [Chloroflexi bacterium]|nr:hypothetical protein [Chloroflexota bacterium]